MTTLVVLFNLKAGMNAEDYERWARTTDLPIVNALPSIEKFMVYRSAGLLGSAAPAPYQYVEVLELKSLAQLGEDVATPTVQRVASEFRRFADDPIFIIGEPL
jgi:hypothetical protein